MLELLFRRTYLRGRRVSLFVEYAADAVGVGSSWLYRGRCKSLPRAKAGFS
jgi:hypothetical protein